MARAKRDQEIIDFASRFITMADTNAIGAKLIHEELVKIRKLLVAIAKVYAETTMPRIPKSRKSRK